MVRDLWAKRFTKGKRFNRSYSVMVYINKHHQLTTSVVLVIINANNITHKLVVPEQDLKGKSRQK